jgi:hypothetical protein
MRITSCTLTSLHYTSIYLYYHSNIAGETLLPYLSFFSCLLHLETIGTALQSRKHRTMNFKQLYVITPDVSPHQIPKQIIPTIMLVIIKVWAHSRQCLHGKNLMIQHGRVHHPTFHPLLNQSQ